ncbi:EbsA family protein [Lactobacillus amylovorus]|uniref:EbsA family protein n=1 Tax=Lactobacillus amylovorus TaxID=1604 RepID=UPI002FE4EC77
MFLGLAGIIYYSWLVIILFIAMILGYEGNKAISISGIVVGIIFTILLIYTWAFSYVAKSNDQFILKLPYRTKKKVNQPTLRAQWRIFQIYQLKGEVQNYSILVISRKKS